VVESFLQHNLSLPVHFSRLYLQEKEKESAISMTSIEERILAQFISMEKALL
jgi:hypothetical protein